MKAKAAETLPENGVPAEIAKLLPYDDLLDKSGCADQEGDALACLIRMPAESLVKTAQTLKSAQFSDHVAGGARFVESAVDG